MDEPALAGLLRWSGRRSRRAYAKVLVWFMACQTAFLYAAIAKGEESVWLMLAAVSSVLGVLHLNALAQRLRDTGRPGLLGLVVIVPVFGMVLAMIMAFQPGQRGPNRYGPDPLHDPLLGRMRR
jgi:uncharacterized membrane protein YhaH (DUF805 family)